MNRHTLLVLALVAGCSEVPKEGWDVRGKIVRSYEQPPAVTADCMARNVAQDYNLNHTATIRGMRQPGTREVVFRIPSMARTLAIAQLEPEFEGTHATIWVVPHIFLDRERFTAALLKGC
jgi:hypothetical protein